MSKTRPEAEREDVGGAPRHQARLDKWLFHARFYRTRAAAQAAAQSGKVRLNGAKVEKPGRAVTCGDVLTLRAGPAVVAVRVVALAERRGPATEARTLYEIAD